uniref:Peptidase S1 domain-containing protein n=1 Tax=Trichuris muris TaxID=70415 RepID=A0A5S6QJM1_TRIMR
MLYKHCWILLLLPLCLAFGQNPRTAPCGMPSLYGGQSIQAYLDNKSQNLVLPWTVAIRNKLKKFKCLGSIIPEQGRMNSSALILTAGSCFRHTLRKRWGKPKHFKVYAGLDRLRLFLNHGEKSKARSIRIMPYNTANENIWNGVALVTLKKPFVFNKQISPVCVAAERRLDEERVRMAPGSVCRFGQFPELANLGGLCSHHERADSEKSLGGPLVCLVNGRAYQYGVYLSQLITRKALSVHKQALHFYGHITTVLEDDQQTASRIIQLGSSGKPTKSSESAPSISSESESREECGQQPPSTSMPRPNRPPPPHCARPPRPSHVSPPRPNHVSPPRPNHVSTPRPNHVSLPRPNHVSPPRPNHVSPPRPPSPPRRVACGDTRTFGRSVESYVIGNGAQDMFPWNVIITSKVRGSTRCIGSLVHRGDERQLVNGTDVVLTAADCFSKYEHAPAAAKSKLRVYAGSPRFSRIRRRGNKVKIANVLLYGLPWGNKQIRRGIAILKLARPLLRQDNVVPVCLAPRESLPPPHASCYVTHYDKREHRIDEEIIMITRNAQCLSAGEREKAANFRGICAIEEKKKHYVQLGSPMVCIVYGRAYQYGVYLNQLSLQINNKVKQNLGFYAEINIVHEVFAGRPVQTLPPRVPHQPLGKPQKPVRPSSSSTSASSEESIRRPVVHVPNVIPSYPTHPTPDHTHSKSTSTSSWSSSSSTESQSTSAESATGTNPSAESHESSESEHTIKINVKLVKPQLEHWVDHNKRRPVVHPDSSSSESRESVRPRPLPNRPIGPVDAICRPNGQRPVMPLPDSSPSNGVLVCPWPGGNINAVPLPTPLPNAEYPSSSLEIVGKVILPSLPKYDMSNKTIATHEHILVRDKVIGESAIAGGVTKGCANIGMAGGMHSLLPGKSSGEIAGNDMAAEIPGVSGSFVTGSCTMGGSEGHFGQQSSHLPGASGVHIFIVSGKSIEALCTGTLYVRPGEIYSDEVVTASRCVKSMAAPNYRVYVGSLLPRKMTVEQLGKTLVEVGGIFATPFYAAYNELKEMGMTVLKLKHGVKVIQGVQSFPLPYSSTGASSRMQCYVSGVCQHGMPVRVQYQLLTPTECGRHLGKSYLPNVMYCGVGQKEILQYPVGSPLVCESSGQWTQFGIYDHTVRTSTVHRVANVKMPEHNEIALFMKLEGDDVARVQTIQTTSL